MQIKIDVEKKLQLRSNLIDVKWSKSNDCALYTSDWMGNFYKYECKSSFEASKFRAVMETSPKSPGELILAFDEYDSNQLILSTSNNSLLIYDVQKDKYSKMYGLLKAPADYVFAAENSIVYAFTRENHCISFDLREKTQKVIWTTTQTINDIAFQYPYFAISLGYNDFGLINIETFKPADIVDILQTGFDGRALSIDIDKSSKKVAVGTDSGFFGSLKSLNNKFEFYDEPLTRKLNLKMAMQSVEIYGISQCEEYQGNKFAFPVNSVRYYQKDVLFTGGGDGSYSMVDLNEETVVKYRSESKDGPITFLEFNKDKNLVAMVQNDDNPNSLFLPDKGVLKIFSFNEY